MVSSGSLHLVIFVSVLCCCFPKAASLYCFVCTSREEKTCGPMFMVDKSDNNVMVQWCTTSCYKLSTKRGDREVVSRGCLPDMKTIDWCRHDRKGDIKGVMCTCNNNYCNATSGLHINLAVLVIAALGAVKYH